MAVSETGSGRVSDAVKGHWVDERAPESWRPYLRMMRMERPIGWQLLLLPCWQGIALAMVATGARWWDLWLFVACLLGAIVMRGAGCCLNDLADRDIDGKVERTRSRPLPSGQMTVRQAVIFMLFLCLIGLLILLTMNRAAIILGFASLLPVMIYPFMKRVTYWPQIFLGIAFNWGALLGWAAHTGALGWAPVFLYLGGICWTVFYDTIYAHQDREDDALIGVKSTALKFGEATPYWLFGFGLGAVLLAGIAGGLAGAGPLFWVGMLAYAGHLAWQLRRLDIHDGEMCLRLFRSNRDGGLLLLLALFLGMI